MVTVGIGDRVCALASKRSFSMNWHVGIAGFAACLLPASASAANAYFHKANVPRQQFIADSSECMELAGGVVVRPMTVYSPDIIVAAASSVFAGFFAAGDRRHLANNVMRTCMTDKGYRRVAPSKELRTQLKKLDDAARAAKLFELASAETPEGEVLPP